MDLRQKVVGGCDRRRSTAEVLVYLALVALGFVDSSRRAGSVAVSHLLLNDTGRYRSSTTRIDVASGHIWCPIRTSRFVS